jgi:hypothetical protein
MGEQNSRAQGTHRGENEGRPSGAQFAGLHGTFEGGKAQDEQSGSAMLQHVRSGKAGPERAWPRGPVLRVGAQQNEDG